MSNGAGDIQRAILLGLVGFSTGLLFGISYQLSRIIEILMAAK